jgi:adenine-specific DNA-methyltransferase
MTEQPEKVDLSTSDLAAANRDALAALFPGVLADGVLDATRLGELLDMPVTAPADGRERFGLMWAGKQEAVRSLLTPSRGTLVPDLERSVDFDNAKNVFIEGDNLEVLKLLQKAYNDRVKLIYIDPPYNTGNDFVYNDDFSDGLRGYLEYTGQLDSEGHRRAASPEVSGRRHSRWLSMMYPRLVLARNLLSQAGVLLCSINDAEFPNLLGLMKEIFGEENFLATFIWTNDGNIEQQSAVKVNHEYIVAFARNAEKVARPSVIDLNIPEDSKLYNDQIENSITKNGPKNPESTVTLPVGFPATPDEFTLAPRDDKYPHILDRVEVKDGQLVQPARLRSGWSSRRLLDLFIENGFVPIEDQEGKQSWFGLTGTGAIYGYKKRSDSQGHVLTVLRNLGTTKASSSLLQKRWGVVFDFPKPERLIQYIVSVFTTGDELVLDFFAGSGTTAHAVALQNAADGSSRRCISVNIPEPVAADSAAAKAGFTTVSEITLRRLEGVISDVPNASDLGLRVLTLGTSAFIAGVDSGSEGQFNLGELTLIEQQPDMDAVLVEVLLKEGVTLDCSISRDTIGTRPIATSAGVSLVQSTDLDDEVVAGALAGGQRVVVFLEDGFAGRDTVKANAFTRARELGITMKAV